MSAIERMLEPQISQARERRLYGLVTAKVSQILDDNTYEVSYLSMGDDDQPSSPARVMMPMAGDKRGTYFHPLVGDEVVVGFEEGDTNQPIILGGVWNEESLYPDQARPSPANDVRTIVSRSNHELTFDDTAGQEKIFLKTQGGHVLEMDDRPGQGKIILRSTGGRTIVLDDTAPGSLTVETPSGARIELSDAGGRLTISAPLQIALQSALITLDANAIRMTTTGTPPASAVMIDGVPYGQHKHFNPAMTSPMTGPVMPI